MFRRACLSLGFAIFVAIESTWAAPQYRGELIFDPPGEHCHGSSIVELPNGDLLTAWFQGSGERRGDNARINGARLKKGSTEWSPVFLMADSYNLPDCNPVLYLDSQGTLWQFWIRVIANRWEDCMLMYRRSTDHEGGGAPNWDWQGVITLIPGEEFPDIVEQKLREARVDARMWGEYAPPYSRLIAEAARDKRKRQTGWMTRIHPIELESGRMVLPLYHDGFNISITAISDDHGATWRSGGPMVGSGPIQPTVVQKKDGSLVAFFRDAGNAPKRILRAESTDESETWTITRDIELPNPGSSLEVIALENGMWAMIHNDKESYPGDNGRNTLSLSLSDDEGETWKWTRNLDFAEPRQGQFSYPSLMQSKDGMLHATYTYNKGPIGRTIKHATFNTDWVMEGDL